MIPEHPVFIGTRNNPTGFVLYHLRILIAYCSLFLRILSEGRANKERTKSEQTMDQLTIKQWRGFS
jgi:hypothetical protein